MRDPQLLSLTEIRDLDRWKLEDAVRARSQAIYLGDYRALCRELGRFKIFVDTRDIGFAPHLMLDGYWEMWLTRFMTRHVTSGQIVMDVGANFGYFTLLLADLVGPQGRCLSVEPNAAAAACIESSISVNGFLERTKVLRCALGATRHPADVCLLVPHALPMNARIVDVRQPIDNNVASLVTVRCQSLDEICLDLPRLDFIKIDAEGGEQDIFDGMQEVLKRFKPSLILEFNAIRYLDPDKFIEKLGQYSFPLRHLDYDGIVKEISAEKLRIPKTSDDWLLYLNPA
jgi:FkbM family methyltransferase